MTKTTRREFATGMTLTAAAAVLGVSPRPADAEPPPETTRLRLSRFPYDHACLAPQWVAEELLRAEGFTDFQYLTTADPTKDLAAGKLDFSGGEIIGTLLSLDAGVPLVIIGGIHAGCFELFGTPRVRSVLDLKNGTIAVGPSIVGGALVTAMATYVGFDPRRMPGSFSRRRRRRCSSSPTRGSMRCWRFRPSPRSCGRERSVMW